MVLGNGRSLAGQGAPGHGWAIPGYPSYPSQGSLGHQVQPPASERTTSVSPEDAPHCISFPSLGHLLPGHAPHRLLPIQAGAAGGQDLGLHLFSEDKVLG